MFLLCQISAISIAGFVILGLFVLLGLWKGAIRMLLDLLVIGLSVAAGALAVKPIRNALAEQGYFGLEWLESILSGNLAFIVVGFATLIVLLIIKAIIMHFVDKKGGKGDIIGKNPGEKPLTVSKDGGDIDAITASTITSRAFLLAVNNAYAAYKGQQVDAASGATQQVAPAEAPAAAEENENVGNE